MIENFTLIHFLTGACIVEVFMLFLFRFILGSIDPSLLTTTLFSLRVFLTCLIKYEIFAGVFV